MRLHRHLIQFLLLASPLAAEMVDYQGRLKIGGVNHDGTAPFKFAIVSDKGGVLWASGEMLLPVSKGIYAVRLGDTAAGMSPVDGAMLRSVPPPMLRIWSNHAPQGWQQLGSDVPLGGPTPASTGAAITATQADAILGELREIRLLLAGRQQPSAPAAPEPPQIVSVPLGDGPSFGAADAPLVVVEFTDYQCGFCKSFHDETMVALKKSYVDTGKLRILCRNLPLDFHQHAMPAAQAVVCAHQQGKFALMRDKLFAASARLSTDVIAQSAKEAGLDMEAFRTCMGSAQTLERVKRDMQDAQQAGISGTPSFVVGTVADGKVTGMRVVGAQSFGAFDTELKKLLSKEK